jgi:hypothetical protein
MTDLPSSLGIESVELLVDGDSRPPRGVTVRVTGRWRRRRAELRGQAMLVVEGPAGRQRFLAMPEPPSLTGAAPGTWRMSFSVPAELAPSLPGRTFLQLGGVMVPLPIGDVVLAGEPAEGPDQDLLEARRVRSSELAAESARRRAAELAAQVEGVEHDLDEARRESERLRASISVGERRLRSAEQDAHAERALRSDLEQELARRTRAARHDLEVLHGRVADLERELTRTRRAVDEAQHLAAAAQAARADAERRLAESRRAEPPPPSEPSPPASSTPASPRPELIRRELELERVWSGPPPPSPVRPRPERVEDVIALRQEATMGELRAARTDADAERVAALERALSGARVGFEQELAGARVGFERELAATRAELGQRLTAARVEIDEQRRRSDRAYQAIEFVRAELRRLHEADPPGPPSPPKPPAPAVQPEAPSPPPAGGPLQPEQLSAALARLREQTPVSPPEEPVDTEPPLIPAAGASRPWLAGVFRRLCAQDASAAGRLLLALLPAQRAADPQPIAYDLALSDLLVAQVTVGSAAGHFEMGAKARPLSEVDFRLVGAPASIARLLVAGPVRRRLSRLAPDRRVARLRGDRERLAALDRLVGARLTVEELRSAGVRLDPVLAMTVAGLMIDPTWTAGERFVLAHRASGAAAPGAYLHVRDGKPPVASGEAPHGPVQTIVVCPADEVLMVLTGAAAPAVLEGEPRPLTLVGQWLERAQCG